MTLGKSFLKGLLCICLCLVMLMSCAYEISDDALSYLESLEENNTQAYCIVIPSSCGELLSRSANALSVAVAEQTGAECRVYFDNYENIPTENRFIILLGNTNYYQSKQALYSLKRDDYVCKLFDDALVLGGKADASTAIAVEKYISEILTLCEPTKIVFDGCDFEYRHEYQINDIILCGFELDNYILVCQNTDNSSAKQLVSAFREYIANMSGYYPDIINSADACIGKREILFSASSTKSTANICFDGEDICLNASSVYGLSVAAEKFYNILIEDSENGSANVNLNYERAYTYSYGDIELGSFILNTSFDDNGISDVSWLTSEINSSASSVIVCGSIPSDLKDTLKKGLSNRFVMESIDISEEMVLPIIIDKTQLSYSFKTSLLDLSVLQIEFSFIDKQNQDEFDFLCFFNVENEHQELARDILNNFENPYIAVCISDRGINVPLEIFGEGASVEYNSMLFSGALKTQLCIFTSENSFECTCVNTDSFGTEKMYSVSVSVRKKFCDAFVLISELQNI